MTPHVFLPLPGNEALAAKLAKSLGGEVGRATLHVFPDGETLVRLEHALRDRDVALVCTLADPDPKLLPLAFAAATARDLGARSVGLVAPYLSYMRQDKAFHDGEGITSVYFARLLSSIADWLVTVDPHLHRHHALADVYSIPTAVAHAALPIADWIRTHVSRPVVIGPDEESEQWVSQVAGAAGAPHRVCVKRRAGDRNVTITIPDLSGLRDRTPVLVDDIVSSGRTIVEASRLLVEAGFPKPVCMLVHYLARGPEAEELARATQAVVSTNTVPHQTNGIDVAEILTNAVRGLPG
jgi:ribose-phosphate pyrophosphokinase